MLNGELAELAERAAERFARACPTAYAVRAARPVRTWREDLALVMRREGDPGPVVAVEPSEDRLDMPFTGEGPAILIWTERNVYFPVACQDTELLETAPRNPSGTGVDDPR